ncbi:DinB family protein [Bacillus sp. V2I10]|uniref:DinB family protein n=1 Tax=Bacillus sp. V2I10 TaxID=3042276 RepID=UPI0035932EA0
MGHRPFPQSPGTRKPQTSRRIIRKKELLSKLEESRRELINFAETAPVQALNEKAMKHPHLGELSLKQWVEFIGYHEKRHLLQIAEVKSEAN